jgi:hypothetical protein
MWPRSFAATVGFGVLVWLPLSPALPHEGGGRRFFNQIAWQAWVSQAWVGASRFGPISASTRAW